MLFFVDMPAKPGKFNQLGELKIITSTLKLIYESGPGLFRYRFILTILQSLIPIAYLFLIKKLVDIIVRAAGQSENISLTEISIITVLFAAVYFTNRTANYINENINNKFSQRLIDNITSKIHKKSAQLDIQQYDTPEFHDSFHRAKQEAGQRPVQLMNNITDAFRNLISTTGILYIFVSYLPQLLFILMLAVIPALIIKLKASKEWYKWQKRSTCLFRKTAYYSSILTARVYAKELRMFLTEKYFTKKYETSRKILRDQNFNISDKKTRIYILSALFESLALFAAIFIAGKQAYLGVLTTGSFVMLFEAFRRGQNYLRQLAGNIAGIHENKLYISNLFGFLNLQPLINTPADPVPFPKKITTGIKLENVCFCYPGSSKKIFHNLNLHLKIGEITKISGKNGSGKSTLLKLICRLYDCDQGNIYIDDINIRKFDLRELRKNISIIFQDFNQFNLSVKENIQIGDTGDYRQLETACKNSQARQVIKHLPMGFDNMLGRYFDNGEELSMGQWQKIALARTLYKDSGIMLFDEPCSWFDKATAAEFMKTLKEMSKTRVIVLIDHDDDKEFECINLN